MFRKTLIGLAAAATAAIGVSAFTASANAGNYGNHGGYNDDGYYQNVGYYYCHYHTKWKQVRVVWYDSYGYPHYKYVWKKIRFCHKHYHY